MIACVALLQYPHFPLLESTVRTFIASLKSSLRKMPGQQIQQIIQDRYIDHNRLQTLLASKFPPGSFSMTVSASPYKTVTKHQVILPSGN